MSSPDEFSPEDLARLAEDADMMYAAFPRSKRSELHSEIIGDPESPFQDGPDDSTGGRFLALALSDDGSDKLINRPLSFIVNNLSKAVVGASLNSAPVMLTNEEKRELYHVILHHMYNIQFRNQYKSPAGGAGAAAEGGRRKLKRRKSTRRKSTRRKSTQRTRNTH